MNTIPAVSSAALPCINFSKKLIQFLITAAVGGACLFILAVHAIAQTAVLTYHNDAARTGANTNETVLTHALVGGGQFGRIFTHDVDGFIFGQPLVMPNVLVPGKGIHDVVYVATMHDSVYAFDADSAQGTNAHPLWQASFINPAAGIAPVGAIEVGCGDQAPEVGVVSTPVIDPDTGTLFVVAKTKEIVGTTTNYYQRLHALDLGTGQEKFGGPTAIQATVPGTGAGSDVFGNVAFDPLKQMNRAALLLQNGVVYIGFASHCDLGPFHGWLFGYDAHTLAQVGVFNTSPNGSEGGIWGSGNGPAGDGTNIYIMTGNGTFDPTNGAYGDSFVKFATTNGLTVADYFTPFNQDIMDENDVDLGSGGMIVLPGSAGSATDPHLIVGAGKSGAIYLVDRDNLGQYNENYDTVVEEMPTALYACWNSPAYFNNTLYWSGFFKPLVSYSIANGSIDQSTLASSPETFVFPPPTPSISANYTSDAIAWIIQSETFKQNEPAILRAYAATNVSVELYNSTAQAWRDSADTAVRFTLPTVANGKVYVGGQKQLCVYGTGTFLGQPAFSPNGAVFTNSVTVTLSYAYPGYQIFYTMDGSAPTTNSPLYTAPLVITNTTGLQAIAFAPRFLPGEPISAGFLKASSIGSGTGLQGVYYAEQIGTFLDPAALTRVDTNINFSWGDVSPGPGVDPAIFSVRWTGSVQAQYTEPYTFITTMNDGIRLWVNNQLVVDHWFPEAPLAWSGRINLVAGQKYPITIEYYSDSASSAKLSWQSPSTPQQVIPQSQLYPGYPAPPVSFASNIGVTNGVITMPLNGPLGYTFVLESSPDLVNWTPVSTNIGLASPFFVSDTLTNNGGVYYRAYAQPPTESY